MRTGGGCRARASVRFSGPGPGAAGASRRGESGVPATTCARELVGSPAVDDPAARARGAGAGEADRAQAARRCAAGTCCARMPRTACRCRGWPPRRGCRFGPPRAGRPATGLPACLGSMVRDTPDGRKLGCRRPVETAVECVSAVPARSLPSRCRQEPRDLPTGPGMKGRPWRTNPHRRCPPSSSPPPPRGPASQHGRRRRQHPHRRHRQQRARRRAPHAWGSPGAVRRIGGPETAAPSTRCTSGRRTTRNRGGRRTARWAGWPRVTRWSR